MEQCNVVAGSVSQRMVFSENGLQSIPVDYHHFLPIKWP